jgi:Tol biopolymer transport system component
LKKQSLTLLAMLIAAAAITVGCGDSHSVPTFKQVAFLSNRTSDPVTSLFRMNLDGSSISPVPFSSSNVWSPSISADFKTVVFISGGDIWVSNADGSTQTQVTTDTDVYSAKVSPDGKKIVYGLYDGSEYQLWTMNVDGTGSLNLTSTMPAGMVGCYTGSFSADSMKIAFACYGSSTYGLFYTKADGTNTVITQSAFIQTPMFSPDGKQILFITFGDIGSNYRPHFSRVHSFVRRHTSSPDPVNQGIASINIDGTNGTIIVPNTYELELLNSTLYYTFYSSDLSRDQIYKSNLDGSGAVSISDGTADDYLGVGGD